eukprot:488169-Amphidinium_carterae.3
MAHHHEPCPLGKFSCRDIPHVEVPMPQRHQDSGGSRARREAPSDHGQDGCSHSIGRQNPSILP